MGSGTDEVAFGMEVEAPVVVAVAATFGTAELEAIATGGGTLAVVLADELAGAELPSV